MVLHRVEDRQGVRRELSVDWVMEGSVRCADGRVVLTAQLIRASDETHVFARRYDIDLAGIFNVQRSVAQAVVEQIGMGRRAPMQRSDMPARIPPFRRPPPHDLVA